MMLRAASVADTHAVAATLAGLACAGDIIALAGDMGAGKTTFAQGFGRALGITEPITSPTFTLVHSYPLPDGRTTLHHADIYRLDTTGDIAELALHELAEFGGVVLVEWGDVADAVLGDHLEVRLTPDVGADADHGDDDDADPADDGDDADTDDDFGLDGVRLIELHASGRAWAGRWDRVTAELAGFAS